MTAAALPEITLKNFKPAPALSKETNAFAADVYIDGKPFCHAENEGRGGMTRFLPMKGADFKQVRAQQEALDARLKDNADDAPSDAEGLVNWAVERDLWVRELKKKPHFFDPKTNEVFTLSGPKMTLEEARRQISGKNAHLILLNDLPIAEAMEKVRAK